LGFAKKTLSALLYCGILASANPSLAQDYSAASDLREGDMRKLIFAEPKDVTDIPFTTPDGENDVSDLPVYLDPKSRFANDMGVRGLPITVILNAQGQEIARMRGDAEWASENAFEVLRAVGAADQGS